MRVLKTILYGYVSYLNIVKHSPGSTNSSLGISSQAMAEKSCGFGRPILEIVVSDCAECSFQVARNVKDEPYHGHTQCRNTENFVR